MLDSFKKRSTALLGVDISSSSIKLLELSRQGDKKFRVERYFSRPLPEGAVVEKNISNLEAVGEEILKLSTLAKTGTNMVAVAVPGSAVITKTIELNASLTDAEMENQITVEADQYIPYPLDEVAIDFERQRPSRKLVNNGDTVVLGGVFREEVTTTISKTPVLGDLPYVGNIFKRTEESESKTELLIFITPTIINDIM